MLLVEPAPRLRSRIIVRGWWMLWEEMGVARLGKEREPDHVSTFVMMRT